MRSIVSIIAVFAAVLVAASAEAQFGTAFSYQGRLDKLGAPVNGDADFEFRLFKLQSGGIQQGSTVSLNNVSVVDGLFTVQIDFGATPFADGGRWIEVSVRSPAGSGPFTVLSRQPLTSVPFAMFVEGIDGHSLDASDGSPIDALYVNPTGNVGIGTLSPAQKLSVVGTVQSTSGGFMFPDGSVQTTASGSGFWAANGLNISNTNSGNVGIGTSNPSRKLEVNATQGVLNVTSSSNANGSVLELRNNTASPVFFGAVNFLNSGGASVGQVALGGDSSLRFSNSTERMRIAADGSVGIGTTTPGRSLHIAAAGDPVLVLQDTGAISTQTGYIGFWNSTSFETAWVGYGTTGSPHFTINNARTGGNIVLSPGPGGVVSVPILEITGADIAEKFPSSEKLEPGMVAAIDSADAGKLCLARGAYNRCVAGVVSGANDFKVGAVLGNLPGHEDAPPIALSGRVYVWCDASSGAIQPGDLLTTSETPGHAMKATERERSHGAVIGKAMERLESGRGLVLVLVNLQ